MVSYRGQDGKQSYHQAEDLADALQFVEHLRNAEAVEHARLFKLEEVSFEYRPYYRVELANDAPPAADRDEGDWIAATPATADAPAPMEGEEDEVDPLAAAWTMTAKPDGESVPAGSGGGIGRKGLFGR